MATGKEDLEDGVDKMWFGSSKELGVDSANIYVSSVGLTGGSTLSSYPSGDAERFELIKRWFLDGSPLSCSQ